MVPITEEKNGDLHIAPTGQKPSGIGAWLGENFSMGMMIAAAGMAAVTLFTGGGSLASLIFGQGVGTMASLGVSLGVLGVGGAIGAVADKRQSDKNARDGITVKKPGFFNRGLLTEGLLKGGLNGMVLGVAAMTLLGGAVKWAGLASVGGLGAFASFGAAVPFAIAGAAALIGAVRGSFSRKEKMEKTYDQVKTAYFVQTGQVDKARGLMQKLGMAGPAVAAGIGAGATGLAAAGKAKAAAVDPSAISTVVGVSTGLNDAPTKEEQYIREVKKAEARDPGHWQVEAPLVEAPESHNAYDFSHMGDAHPAAQAQRSFLEAEMERRAALVQGQSGPTIH